jgi:hypothetical protein
MSNFDLLNKHIRIHNQFQKSKDPSLVKEHQVIRELMEKEGFIHDPQDELDELCNAESMPEKNMEMNKLSLSKLSHSHLLAHHFWHGASPMNWTKKDIAKFHTDIVTELEKRGSSHKNVDTLDLTKEHHDPDEDKNKQEKSTINLSEVLSCLTGDFKVHKDYVCLVGDLVKSGESKKGLDIWIKGEDLPADVKSILEYRITKALPPSVQSKVNFIYDQTSFEKSNTYVPLFDMAFIRTNQENKSVELQADEFDTLKRFITPEAYEKSVTLKDGMHAPDAVYKDENRQLMDAVVEYFTGDDIAKGIFVSKKVDGILVKFSYINGNTTIFSEDGLNVTHRFGKVVKDLKSVCEERGINKFVGEGFIDFWEKKSRSHMHKDFTKNYAKGEDTPDDTGAVLSVFNVLDLVQNKTAYEGLASKSEDIRQNVLQLLELPSSDINPPAEKSINYLPVHKVDTEKDLISTGKRLAKLCGSEGAIFRKTDSTYGEDGSSCQVNNTTVLAVKVLEVKSINDEYSRYTFSDDGINPSGITNKTKVVADKKDIIEIEVEKINNVVTNKVHKLFYENPRVLKKLDRDKPDTSSAIIGKSKRDKTYNEKQITNGKANYTLKSNSVYESYFPQTLLKLNGHLESMGFDKDTTIKFQKFNEDENSEIVIVEGMDVTENFRLTKDGFSDALKPMPSNSEIAIQLDQDVNPKVEEPTAEFTDELSDAIIAMAVKSNESLSLLRKGRMAKGLENFPDIAILPEDLKTVNEGGVDYAYSSEGDFKVAIDYKKEIDKDMAVKRSSVDRIIWDGVEKYYQYEFGPCTICKNIYMVSPEPGKKYQFVAQYHARGKSIHNDIRMETNGKNLIGWTLNTQIAGAVKEPITKLSKLKEIIKGGHKFNKIDFNNGAWVKRRTVKGDPLDAEIMCEKKPEIPHAWLTVEGDDFNAGSTKNNPAVFAIADKGNVEYLAQKNVAHEYMFAGKGLNYRVLFRRLGTEAFKFLIKNRSLMDSIQKRIMDDDLDEYIVSTAKAKELPAAEQNDLRGDYAWLVIKPKEQSPYVLSSRAKSKGWVPDHGVSALPSKIEKKVPDRFKYWNIEDASERKSTRDALLEAIQNKEVTLPK